MVAAAAGTRHAATAITTSAAMPPHRLRFRHVPPLSLVSGKVAGMHPCKYGCKAEKDGIHNTQRKARFEHSARLDRRQRVNTLALEREQIASAGKPVVGAMHIKAVGFGDKAQLVDGGNKCAHEGEVDKGNKVRVAAAAVVAKQREDSPDDGKHRDYEKYEDIVGRELVFFDVGVNEPGKHAHDRNLREKRGALANCRISKD